MTDTAARTYVVAGMSCEHCRASVLEAVSEVQGVDSAEVDLAARTVTVSGSDFADRDVAAAVDQAGYEAKRAG